ncbi:MAG: sulfatase-like hydrolase/transferase [Terrimicrobiaceae bacterium]
MFRFPQQCDFLGGLVAVGLVSGFPAAASEVAKPNILVIVADDLGWGDLSCYGQRRWETPNLDRLASRGTLFTQGYMPSAVCSPSRAGMLTGRFPGELGIHGHLADPGWNKARGIPDALDPAIATLPRTLQAEGYRTIHVGKWHLGPYLEKSTQIQDYGFDDVRWPHCYSEDREVSLWSHENRPRATDELVRATLEAIKQAHADGKPFYAQLWLNDPHADLAPAAEEIAKFDAPVRDRNLPYTTPFSIYAATITTMDRGIGELLDGLESSGLADNTLVIFTSDNGPEDIEIRSAQWSAAGTAGPLRGRKRSLYDGGIRVPWIMSWPGHIPEGAVNDTTVIGAVDLFPSLASLTDASLADGISKNFESGGYGGEDLSAVFRGDQTVRRKKPMFWEWREEVVNHPWNRSPMLAVREGEWKLLLNPDRSRVELYNVAVDPGEQDNLASSHSDIVERLAAHALKWQSTLPKGRVDPRAGRNDYPWPKAGNPTPVAVE